MSETRKRDERGRLLPGPVTDYSRYARGDRDPGARAANTQRKAGNRTPAVSIPDEDKRTERVVTRLTGEHGALFKAKVAEAGITEADYLRDLILQDLGVTDTARRPAPRQPKREDATR